MTAPTASAVSSALTACTHLRTLAVEIARLRNQRRSDLLQDTPTRLDQQDSDHGSAADKTTTDPEMKALLNASTNIFCHLLQCNRAAAANSKSRRNENVEVKNAMDQTRLVLQNLNYERQHLSREISRCDAYESLYQDIPPHPLEEFDVLAPLELRDRSSMEDVEHQLMLNRLEFELNERKRLLDVLAAHKAERDKIEAENKIMSAELDEIDAAIAALYDSSVPLQKRLGLIQSPIQNEPQQPQESTQQKPDPEQKAAENRSKALEEGEHQDQNPSQPSSSGVVPMDVEPQPATSKAPASSTNR